MYSVREPLHCIYYKLRRWRDEAAVIRGLIRFMVAFYGLDETLTELESPSSMKRGILVAWRALGSQIHALVLEGDESADARAFQKMCDDLEVADNGMVAQIVWGTIDLMAAGATPGIFADALEASAEDCEALVPLLAALRKLEGRPERVPEEFEKVVGDIVRTTEERRG